MLKTGELDAITVGFEGMAELKALGFNTGAVSEPSLLEKTSTVSTGRGQKVIPLMILECARHSRNARYGTQGRPALVVQKRLSN